MQDFIKSYPFILSFLFMTLLIQMTLGDRITYQFLWLVLLSMLVVNHNKIKQVLKG